jgi:hypothetical protein
MQDNYGFETGGEILIKCGSSERRGDATSKKSLPPFPI